MPGGDGTGPFGAFRNCTPVDAQGRALPFYGRSFGRGRGLRFRFLATGVPGRAASRQPYFQGSRQPSQEGNKAEIAALEQELEEIKKRLAELKME